MRKLVNGIIQFRKTLRPEYRETFARLALGQSPDTLMIACSDSRVVPNLFASADPGDLFVVRNVGNLVAPCGADGVSVGDESEPAAIEFAVGTLGVTDIIVCGHSECGAMRAVQSGLESVKPPHLRSWLRCAAQKPGAGADSKLAAHNQLSQTNVLEQIAHLKTYAIVRERLAKNTLRLHGWWFDIAQADVYAHDPTAKKFTLIDEPHARQILAQLA